jgi:glycosyltransferase involved in cell wall biosynthesis
MTKASIIICTWNRARSLAATLASLEASIVPPDIEWEVLVVDNNSTDETRKVCESFVAKNPQRFGYLLEKRQGKSYALNSGMQHVRGDILMFTDDDVTVHQDWVSEIVAIFRAYDCAGVGGRVIPVWKCKQPAWLELDGPYYHPAFCGVVRFEKGDSPFELKSTPLGANLAFKRSIVERYGLFRTDLSGNHADRLRPSGLLGGEDTEYCRRVLNAGEKLIYAPKAIVCHPVEVQRVTRKYFRRFAFNSGRYITRMGGVPDQAICYFDVPRYLLRFGLVSFVKWMTALNTKRRLHYMLELSQTFGHMVEAKNLVRARRTEIKRQLNGLTE